MKTLILTPAKIRHLIFYRKFYLLKKLLTTNILLQILHFEKDKICYRNLDPWNFFLLLVFTFHSKNAVGVHHCINIYRQQAS